MTVKSFKKFGKWFFDSASYTDNLDITETYYNSALYFKPDGTEMYVCWSYGTSPGRYIEQYTLSTAWDVTSGTSTGTYSISESADWGRGIFFKPDGTKMYVLCDDISATISIFQYTLSTAWDVTSASYDSVSLVVDANAAYGLYISPDGSNLYYTGFDSDYMIYENPMSTPWDLSTAGTKVSTTVPQAWHGGLHFKWDGTLMYTLRINTTNNVEIATHLLKTPWDVSSAKWIHDKIMPEGGDSTDRKFAVFLNTNGGDAYVNAWESGIGNNYVLHYTLI